MNKAERTTPPLYFTNDMAGETFMVVSGGRMVAVLRYGLLALISPNQCISHRHGISTIATEVGVSNKTHVAVGVGWLFQASHRISHS